MGGNQLPNRKMRFSQLENMTSQQYEQLTDINCAQSDTPTSPDCILPPTLSPHLRKNAPFRDAEDKKTPANSSDPHGRLCITAGSRPRRAIDSFKRGQQNPAEESSKELLSTLSDRRSI